MTLGSLFSGIGGFELGLEQSGLVHEVKWQVEIDPYCQKVLAKHWPETKRYGDIKEVGKHNLESVDIICGGFPCQPYSTAGKQQGADDDRALWPEMVRVIEEIRPTLVIGENVLGFIKVGLDEAISDLASLGYSSRVFIIPACSVDSQQLRKRIFVIAYSNSELSENAQERHDKVRLPECMDAQGIWPWGDQPPILGADNGVPNRVDRIKSLGNAVVPQVACAIGTIIREWINML